MTLIYPNIVPENNLRLPDALTIKHGPAPLLARFVLEGDKAARRMGLRLRLRHDFPALLYFNRQEIARGNWFRPRQHVQSGMQLMFHPKMHIGFPARTRLARSSSPGPGASIIGRKAMLAEQACAMFYGRDDGQPYRVATTEVDQITGVVL